MSLFKDIGGAILGGLTGGVSSLVGGLFGGGGDKQKSQPPATTPDMQSTPTQSGITTEANNQGDSFITSMTSRVGEMMGDVLMEAGQQKAINSFRDKPMSGKEIGQRMKDVMDTVYPDTTPMERLKSGGGGVTGASVQTDIARMQTKSAEKIAKMNNNTVLKKTAMETNRGGLALAQIGKLQEESVNLSQKSKTEFHRTTQALHEANISGDEDLKSQLKAELYHITQYEDVTKMLQQTGLTFNTLVDGIFKGNFLKKIKK
jgi:hypothetical protein